VVWSSRDTVAILAGVVGHCAAFCSKILTSTFGESTGFFNFPLIHEGKALDTRKTERWQSGRDWDNTKRLPTSDIPPKLVTLMANIDWSVTHARTMQDQRLLFNCYLLGLTLEQDVYRQIDFGVRLQQGLFKYLNSGSATDCKKSEGRLCS